MHLEVAEMSRTVVDLKDELVERAKRLTGLTREVELVNCALERLARQKEIEGVLKLEGRIDWSSDWTTTWRDGIDMAR